MIKQKEMLEGSKCKVSIQQVRLRNNGKKQVLRLGVSDGLILGFEAHKALHTRI